MKLFRKSFFLRNICLSLFLAAAVGVFARTSVTHASDPWQPSQIVQPAQVAKQLSTAKEKPMLVQVGFLNMYKQAHIPGSKYCGPTYTSEGIALLKKCVEGVPKTQAILIYCGCCPFTRCPNVRPAFVELGKMGFKNLKAMSIPTDFGKDWVSKGYPVASGE